MDVFDSMQIPRDMLAAAQTNAEAQQAIEQWCGKPLTDIELGIVIPRGNAINIGKVFSSKTDTQIRIQCYPSALKGRDRLHATTELVFTKESARAFAEFLLKVTE